MLIYNWNGKKFVSHKYDMVSDNARYALFHIYDFLESDISDVPNSVIISNPNWEITHE